MTTTPDPLSAAVEAFKFDGAREGVTYPENMRVADYERAVLSARIQAAVTAYIEATGMVLVPREPDLGMIGAWYRVKNGHHFHDKPPPEDRSDCAAYRAMIAASPAPTVEVG